MNLGETEGEEWLQPESVDQTPSVPSFGYPGTLFFNGGDSSKYGTWAIQDQRRTKDLVLCYLSSCRIKLLQITYRKVNGQVIEALSQSVVVGGGDSWWNEVYRLQLQDWPDKEETTSVKIQFQRSKCCPCPSCERRRAPSKEVQISILDSYERLFFSAESADVIFSVGDAEIPAHKSILVSRYENFKSLFAPGTNEATTNRIKIDYAVSAENFRGLLRFVYCGKLPKNLDLNAMEYLDLADRYRIQDLKSVCSNVLAKSLSRENVVKTLLVAQRYGCGALKDKCLVKLKKFKDRGDLTEEDFEPLKSDASLLVEFIMKST